jgi:hypothetical protein
MTPWCNTALSANLNRISGDDPLISGVQSLASATTGRNNTTSACATASTAGVSGPPISSPTEGRGLSLADRNARSSP